ncbi:pore-forming ESAT-6 family protein [Clavibacter sepedonicus]|uniref:Uncharacterized protein n=1 Tax=Clavibacter sepedonicus TaxID=31964 RepID=B0RGC6_CLASE|nr:MULTISPECIES: pore-forming ESAT-6 family protein [Clavibacter]MBD5382137.1 pore-forming ESAT-6 family protein [Clavibacter sp.]OQJ46936.1 hypothetical protein B5P19_00550 [Clavibacter sepedonicus]OQJ55123.1 hypothetical protein B5P20_14240 [Clavibacter sepedonicus]UUK66464.1 pore-forming ESAT-6 family protein [Clavibacter sepedonicus]CAQ01182.1 conserved hypothetical protein [Clavibacter sepedonicus]
MSGNSTDRRDYDIAASQSAQDEFQAVASHLESLLDQRDSDVKAAMADYQADGVSTEYAAKEARWNAVAQQVRDIIHALRQAMARNDETAQTAMSRGKAAVDSIG